jgi:hypothetical protein
VSPKTEVASRPARLTRLGIIAAAVSMLPNAAAAIQINTPKIVLPHVNVSHQIGHGLPTGTSHPQSNTFQVNLNVTERTVTSVSDPGLSSPASGGPSTTGRGASKSNTRRLGTYVHGR